MMPNITRRDLTIGLFLSVLVLVIERITLSLTAAFCVVFFCAYVAFSFDDDATMTISNDRVASGSSIVQSGSGSMHLTTDDGGEYILNGFPISGVTCDTPIMVEMAHGGAVVNGVLMNLVDNCWVNQ